MSPASSPPRQSKRRTRWIVLPLVIALLLGSGVGVAIAAFIHMPKVEGLADFTPGIITRLFDDGAEEFATFARERRILLEVGEVPPLVQQTILSAEDSAFFDHGGIDPKGVLRSLLRNAIQGTRIGGSTLTMQLARTLYLTPEKTWRRKIEEALLTVEIEKKFSKEQILTLYSNVMYFGHGNYGVEAAARSFFGKTAAELEVKEAATLAGVLQRPSAYSPYNRPDLVLERRNYVLRRMVEEGYLSPEEHDRLAASPLDVVPRTTEDELAPYFAEEVRRYLEDHFGTETVLQKGLQVRTTLNPAIQRAAEAALRSGLARLDHRRGWRGAPETLDEDALERPLEEHELSSWRGVAPKPGEWIQGIVLGVDEGATIKIGGDTYRLTADGARWTGRRPRQLLKRGDVAWFRFEETDDATLGRLVLEQEPELEGAVVVLESATGAVRAMVGGWDFERSKFNRVTQAKRQTGSAFKPFVFGAALEMGFTPADTVFDAPVVFPGDGNQLNYSPRNYYRRYYGILTLRRALEQSVNVTAVKLQDLVGVDQVIDFAQRCGIESDLPPYPSLALGAADLSPLELAGAYAAIANQGIYLTPYFIEAIEDPSGNVLESHRPQARKAMDPGVAFLLAHMLKGVVDRGTAKQASSIPTALAGKTGTHDSYTDAWFAGFTPRYTLLTWVGYDQKRSIGRNMTGAEAALPIWQSIVERGVEEGWIATDESFDVPPGVHLVAVEHQTGLLPGPGAERLVEEAFLQGTEPVQQFERKRATIATLPWYQQRPFYLPKDGERMPEQIEDWSLVQRAWGGSRSGSP